MILGGDSLVARTPAVGARPWPQWLAVATLVLAGVAAYLNSFSVPFIFDDDDSIRNNPTIRQLWPLWEVLTPPPTGAGVTNRPFVNLSLALNYAAGGLHVEGYHLVNLAIHLLAALALYGIVRRTLLLPPLHCRYGPAAIPVAWLTALLWLVHPLLTESVTCVIQRTESLMGLLYLATMYAAVRSMVASRPLRWQAVAVAACLAGMATKEVMVSAPLLVLLYDRTFVAGSFLAAWRLRRGFYVALALTWLLLGWLVIGMGGGTRGNAAGFTGEITWWEYLFTQAEAIVLYLKLSVWPHPLVLDYGTHVARNLETVIPCGALVLGLALATLVAIWRKAAGGFLGAWFFAILAPSSSVVPLATQTIAEHRMYLPLAAVIGAAVLGLYRWLGRRMMAAGLVVATGLLAATVARNHDYRSVRSIWEDNLAKRPAGARAHVNLGAVLMLDPAGAGEALRHFEEAIRLQPSYGPARVNLATILSTLPGRETEAEAIFRELIRVDADNELAHRNLGILLGKLAGREGEAVAELRTAIRLQPEKAEGHAALGSVLVKVAANRPEGLAELREAVRLDPGLAEAWTNLGMALAGEPGQLDEAVRQLQLAVTLKPDSAEARNNLAVALAKVPGRQAEAVAAYQAAIRLKPGYWEAQCNLGMLLLAIPGRATEAVGYLETVTRLAPDFADAHTNLGMALADMPDRFDEAVIHFEAAVRAKPGVADTHFNLATALARVPGRETEAESEFQAALSFDPNDAEAQAGLGLILAHMDGRSLEAVGALEKALQLRPDLPEAHYCLASILQASGARLAEAIEHLEAAVKLAPNLAEARELLDRLSAQRRP